MSYKDNYEKYVHQDNGIIINLMNKIKNLHFVGIGGAGMSGIARILLALGYTVTGSDIKYSPMVETLEKLGAKICIGHQKENLNDSVEAVVYSSAVNETNPEVAAALSLKIPVFKRAEMLAFLMSRQQSIAIAGAHGKTTTTGMISLMLSSNQLDPSIVIGGVLPQIDSNAQLGRGQYIVAEADESDGSFLLLHPKIAVVTNVEDDHLDYYRSVDNIVDAFYTFIKQLPTDGFAVFNADNHVLRQIMTDLPKKYITYAIEHEADYTVTNVNFVGRGSTCNVFYHGQKLGQLVLAVPGIYNISNALAAIAVGIELGLTFDEAVRGLNGFSGTGRRFEILGDVNDILVVDDYAHHPTEVKSTLKAAGNMGFNHVIVVFQPHRYSRTQLLHKEFGQSFGDCDTVIINEIYAASEQPIAGVSAKLILDDIPLSKNKSVLYAATEDDVVAALKSLAQPGDIVLVMGAGNIRNAGLRFVEELQALVND